MYEPGKTNSVTSLTLDSSSITDATALLQIISVTVYIGLVLNPIYSFYIQFLKYDGPTNKNTGHYHYHYQQRYWSFLDLFIGR